MSHGHWFMQRCFASCIGYEVSNEWQYGTDEEGRNVVAAVTATGGVGWGGVGRIPRSCEMGGKMNTLHGEKQTLCTQ